MNYKKIIKTCLLITVFCTLFTQCSFAEQPDYKKYMIAAQNTSSIKEKIDYYNKATAAELKAEEPDYMLAAQSAFNIGLIAGKAKYRQESIRGYLSCIESLKKIDKFENSEMAFLSLHNLAHDYKGLKQYENVKNTYIILLSTQKKIPKKYHYELCTVYYDLGYYSFEEGDFQQANRYFNIVVANLANPNGKEEIDLKTHSIFRLGDVKLKLNQPKEALGFYMDAIIRSKFGYPDIIRIADAYSNIGTIYENQGNVKKAKSNYEKAIEYYKKAEFNKFYLEPNLIGSQIIVHPQKAETYKRLIALEEKSNEKTEKINQLKKESSQYILIKRN